MRPSIVRTIYLKELLETVRDVRTLVLAFVVPLVIYPLMALLVVQVQSCLQRQLQDVELTVAARIGPSDLRSRFEALAREKRFALVMATDTDAAQLTRDGTVNASIVVPGDESALPNPSEEMLISIYYDSGMEKSREAKQRLEWIVDQLRSAALKDRLTQFELPAKFASPFLLQGIDTATAQRRGAYLLGGILSFLLITMALSGAFYVAVDTTAGEKERGTLETLLATPVARQEIVLGKFLAIVTVAILSSLANIASMGLTFSNIMRSIGQNSSIDFALGPWVLVGILATLIPLAALFSAVTLGTSSFARSFREGQNYLTPVFLMTTFPAMLPMIPGVELTLGVAAVPVAGPALFFRYLLLNEATLEQACVVFGSTMLYASLALLWATRLYQREEIIFTGAGAATRISFRRKFVPVPGAQHAMSVYFGCLTLFAYCTLNAGTEVSILQTLMLPQMLILAGVASATWFLRHQIVDTFALRAPPLRAWLAVPFLTAGGILALLIVNYGVQSWLGEPKEFQEQIRALIRIAGPIGVFGAIALLPAVAEELLCRGYLLTGLRRKQSAQSAVLLSGFLFGVLHLQLDRIPGTALMGVLLGFVALRCGSIFPGMVIHFLNNSCAVLLFSRLYEDVFPDHALTLATQGLRDWLFANFSAEIPWRESVFGVVLLVVGILLLPRAKSAPEA